MAPEDVEELRKLRVEMENELFKSIQKIVGDFEAKTGLTPYNIEVQLHQSMSLGDPKPNYKVTDVRTSVEL